MSALQVTMLGTGSPLPDPDRAGSAVHVSTGATNLLVDCGRGVLMRAAAAGTPASGLTALLLTHLHSDHITDFNDVVTTRWITSFVPNPLPVYGPTRTQEMIDGALASHAPDVEFRLAHHDDLPGPPEVPVTELTGDETLEIGDVRVVVAPTEHRPVFPSLGYRIEHDGHAVVLAGDTLPCAGLDRLCEGADVLVHTVIRKDLIEHAPVPRLVDICDYHSSVAEAAQSAARGGVGKLVLTHCVPALVADTVDEWRDLAAAHFEGEIHLAEDLDRISVG